MTARLDAVLGNARVPASLVADAQRFGGRRDRDCFAGNLVVRGGSVAGMSQDGPVDTDLGGRLVTTPFVEPHCHLDKCFTIERLDFAGGSLLDAITAQSADKANWTYGDLRGRAERGIREMVAAGTRMVRTHVDWEVDMRDPDRLPLAWRVIGDLAEEWRGRITIQRAALLPIASMADAGYSQAVGRVIAQSGGALGAFVFDQPERAAGIHNMFSVAARHGLALDFHVDEGLSPELDGLELIAREAARTAHAEPVLCGHACNLAVIEQDVRKQRIELTARAGLSVVALPSSNLYLQDRDRTIPRERGLTAVSELLAAGVNVAFGTDNVQDAFCPVGIHDPKRTLAMGVLAAHLPPPLGDRLPLVMQNAAKALGQPLAPVDRSPADALLIWETGDVAELVSGGTYARCRSLHDAMPSH
ncbi:amidohydrolase family protein [Neoaquamicrobium sediminum]|uniref:Amidohydrolase family protein n=1 Tax=Neoaquamicrobium sediminum TaxID=1849104 RepID=A0ABV3WWI4_9HYPH